MDKFTNIKERILYVANFKNISYVQFFDKIGMTYGNFKGKSKLTPINSNAIANIITIYPDINSEWLLTGKGNMLKEEESTVYKVNGQTALAYNKENNCNDRIIKLLEAHIALLEENKFMQAKEIERLNQEVSSLKNRTNQDIKTVYKNGNKVKNTDNRSCLGFHSKQDLRPLQGIL